MKKAFLMSLLFVAPVLAAPLAGLWDASINVSGTEIPFRFGLSGDGDNVKGWFFNGDAKEISSSGTLRGGALVLHFDSYASVLKATVKDGVLDGEYVQRGKSLPVHATAAAPHPAPATEAPDISGQWFLENVNSSKAGEKAWHLIVRQKGPEVSASILRVDGDTGILSGSWREGRFVLSHFSGARPALVAITPQPDGTLTVDLAGQHHEGVITAFRPQAAKTAGLPEPVDADQHTGVKDSSQPFAFSFPDLNGKVVSNTDDRFKGKVVLVNITGSWCPNCHDEAPFLAALYDKYHSQGLEIVALSFEEAEQLENPVRLKAFIREYGIKYTVLLGGETSTAKDKLASAANWDAWPTTFFIGRDGLVKGAHAGFPGPGSGILYKQETDAFVAKVQKLLSEAPASSH